MKKFHIYSRLVTWDTLKYTLKFRNIFSLQINQYENVGNVQALFTYKYRWLAVLTEGFPKDMENDISNITHFSVITDNSSASEVSGFILLKLS